MNSIPANMDVPSSTDIGTRFLQEERWKGAVDSGELLVAYHQAAADQLPGVVRDFVGLVMRDRLVEATDRYSFVVEGRKVLRAIARADKSKKVIELESTLQLEFLHLEIDSDRRIAVVHTELLRVLEGLEVDRIKECPVCGTIFWAGRKDQPACNRKCTQTLRVRRWREKYQDDYKPQRIRKADEREIGNSAIGSSKGKGGKGK